MSYLTIATMTQDAAMNSRLTACAAEQNKTRPYPEWVANNVWDIVAEPGWAAAWESAVAGGITNPGADPGVITDGMILAAVQPLP